MVTRFAIATLGCKVNQYDSAIIESRLSARGMERRDFTEQADVYIVNTCTITDRADAESLRIARRARRLNPSARIVMTGCLAQASPDVLAKAAEVDAVIGLGRLDDLHARGFKEVVLTGVHLGGYGKDLDPPVELADLLEMIAERCPLERVRISSLDPEELSDRIVEIISGSEKFCPHLHLPLQSGDDETLSRMRRRYVRDYFRDRVERVLRAWPDAANTPMRACPSR